MTLLCDWVADIRLPETNGRLQVTFCTDDNWTLALDAAQDHVAWRNGVLIGLRRVEGSES